MSPAFVDSGASPPPCINGQIFYPHFNSSNNINDNHFSFNGFSNQMDPNIGFSSPSLGASKPAAGLSRPPRFTKLRKPLVGHRPNLLRPVSQSGAGSGLEDSGLGPGHIDPGLSNAKPTFEQSQQNVGRGFVFGSNDGSQGVVNHNAETSKVVDEMSKLKIESEKAYSNRMNASIGGGGSSSSGTSGNLHLSDKDHSLRGGDESVVSELPEDMRRLCIESERFSKLYGGNLEELPNKMKKLNVKDSQHDASKNFSFERSDSKSLDGSSDVLLPDKMKNLEIGDSIYTSTSKKVDDVSSGDKNKFMFKDGGNVNQPVHSNATCAARESPNHLKTNKSLESGAETMHDMLGKNLGDGCLDNSGSFSSGFIFQVGLESKNSGSHVSFGNQSNTSLPVFSFTGVHSIPVGHVPEVPSADRGDKKVEFCFTSKLDNMAAQHVEFKTPDAKVNSLFGLNRKFETKRDSSKDSGLKKKKGKCKKPAHVPMKLQHDFVFQDNLHNNAESSEQCSPMDFSPYEETLASNMFSRETSVASEESVHLGENNYSSEAYPSASDVIADEVLVSATKDLHINEYDVRGNEGQDEEYASLVNEGIKVESPEEDAVSGAETESFKSATDELDYSSDSFVTAADTEVSSSSRIERQYSDGGTQFKYDTSLAGTGQSNFAFAASSSSVSNSSASLRIQKKKSRIRQCHDSCSSTPSAKFSHASSHLSSFHVPVSSFPSREQGQKDHILTVLSLTKDECEQVKEPVTKEDSATPAAIAAQESCERWRLRGNQAYAKGDFSKAEDCYTQGVNCISQNETSRSCLRALMLCYSNRAATRISLGRLREALEDCKRASGLDPDFLRVQVRAASCYLALGEVENATVQFMKCLQAGSDVCADRKLLVEASQGLENAKKVAECVKQASELMERRGDIDSAVSLISEGLMISSYSETLLQMKVDALLMLKKYDELIQFCEQILGSVESNFLMSGGNRHSMEFHGSDLKRAPSFRIWCWSLIFKSYFYLGRLDEAIDFLKKQEEQLSLVEREIKPLESMIPLIGTIRELLHHKAAGNEAYKSGKHAEAVEHYSAAIACSVESRPFAAICFCNRAAAYRSMGQLLDAIADCCLAIALDGNYYKAISRRASLYEMIRDYGQAVSDLQKLISLLTAEVDKRNQSGKSDKVDIVNELRQARLKLLEMEEAARNDIPLNMYLILGVDPSAPASEIKKAYRKAALKYHPDKAGQSLARNENQDDGIWKKIAEEVHKDADRLFKITGEAYAALSDPTKRSRYDLEEEMRNAPNRGNSSNPSNINSDFHNHPFERSGRRQWQEFQRSYGYSTRGSERNHHNWYS